MEREARDVTEQEVLAELDGVLKPFLFRKVTPNLIDKIKHAVGPAFIALASTAEASIQVEAADAQDQDSKVA